MTLIGQWVHRDPDMGLLLPDTHDDFPNVIVHTHLGIGGSPLYETAYWNCGRHCFGLRDLYDATHLIDAYYIVPSMEDTMVSSSRLVPMGVAQYQYFDEGPLTVVLDIAGQRFFAPVVRYLQPIESAQALSQLPPLVLNSIQDPTCGEYYAPQSRDE